MCTSSQLKTQRILSSMASSQFQGKHGFFKLSNFDAVLDRKCVLVPSCGFYSFPLSPKVSALSDVEMRRCICVGRHIQDAKTRQKVNVEPRGSSVPLGG